jgi:hypothetical protein
LVEAFFATLVFVLVTASVMSCKTVPIPPTVVSVAADCGAPAIRDLATSLLDDVASALISKSGFEGALAAIETRVGADGKAAVKCAVEELLSKYDGRLAAKTMGADDIALTQNARDNAAAWLKLRPDPAK